MTGTEVARPVEEPVPRMEGLDDEVLLTLREIRDILKAESQLKKDQGCSRAFFMSSAIIFLLDFSIR